jgi:Membrane protein involved in the export of O-antigen and teichoic acid
MIFDKLLAFIDRLSPGLRKVIANTTWLFADKILQLGMGLLVGLWVARYLQPERFGLLNYAMATAGLFAPIANLGLNSIVIRDLSRDSSNKEEILGTVFCLKKHR